jgi:hypothetical protein
MYLSPAEVDCSRIGARGQFEEIATRSGGCESQKFLIMDVKLLIFLLLGTVIGFGLGCYHTRREAAGVKRSVWGMLLVIIGGVCLVVDLGVSLFDWHFVHVASYANGKVVAKSERADQDSGSICYAPTFRFQDATGVSHTVASSFFNFPPEFHVGDRAPVLYLSSDPQVACIDTFEALWEFSIYLAFFGGATLSIGMKVMAQSRIIVPTKNDPPR